ncbi:hypothetical protein NHQ30_000130 [Ciborinia camelliae]|nr:hypothetical protein NHQ30_000130 [Ciborinia camelliae]
MQRDRNDIAKHALAIQICLQPEDILEESSSKESKQQSLYANILGPLENILTAYGIQTENLDSALGGEQEFLVQTTRCVLKTRNSSSTSIQSADSTNSIDSNSTMTKSTSIHERTGWDSVPAKRWFEDLQNYVFPLIDEEPMRRVKIAILDTGIDLPSEIIPAHEDRIAYRSFLERDNAGSTDTCGHGTHAAGLLISLA